jgi:hypothetical protein
MTPTTDKPEAKSESKPETKPETKPAAAPGAKSDAQKNLKSIPMEELQKKLGSSPDGLSEAEAKKRLAQYGPNEIAEKKENPYLKFLTYFWGPIPWMIEGAVILSGAVRHWPDFFIILLLLLSNAVVGFWGRTRGGQCDRRSQDLGRVFDKFYRVAELGPTNGLGLGLAICKAFIEAHNGRISLENNQMGGTVARFVIPVHQAAMPRVGNSQP